MNDDQVRRAQALLIGGLDLKQCVNDLICKASLDCLRPGRLYLALHGDGHAPDLVNPPNELFAG